MADEIPFRREMAFDYGRVDALSAAVRRLVARNPGPFTFRGTNTYIVGRGRVAVIDPGPDLREHRESLRAALAGEEVTHILVTHTHRDHSPLAGWLKAETGAPTFGFGRHGSGRPGEKVEEGGDTDFAPDVRLADGDGVEGEGFALQALHTPGHCSNHICFVLAGERALFSGDHVMGWSTSEISPPDGEMRAYMGSLRKLLARADAVYYPGHGPPILDPRPFVAAVIAHREERERQILAALSAGARTIPEIVAAVYVDLPEALLRAAARSVHAHLIHMVETGRARAGDAPGPESEYAP